MMRYQIKNHPKTIAVLLGVYVGIFAFLGYAKGWGICVLLAAVYTLVCLYASFLAYRITTKEKVIRSDRPERLLILAPHQDDCVIMAGGFGIRNLRLGGETYIVYLTRDQRSPELAAARTAEAIKSWRLAGTPTLHHLDILPKYFERNPDKIYETARCLQDLIDKIKPTVLLLPLFEGGNIQHDITNYIVSFLIRKPEGLRIYECPEYSPYFSFLYTPHKMLGALSRLFLIFVSYLGPPDGIDGRDMLVLDMSNEELCLKNKMLSAFASQGGEGLADTFRHPDRVIEWKERAYRSTPFHYRGSLAHFRETVKGTPFERIVHSISPGEFRSYGKDRGITDLDEELGRR